MGLQKMGSPPDRQRPIFAEIQKSSTQRLRVEVVEFHGSTYVDLRIWVAGAGGEWKPSGRGVSMRPSQIAQIVQGLLLAARAIDPQGGPR